MPKIRTPGAFRRGGLWCCKVKAESKVYYLGSHLTAHRASMAGKLFKFWQRQGFPADQIPTKPDSVDFTGPLMRQPPRGKRGAPMKPVIGTSQATGESVRFQSVSEAMRVGGFDRAAICRAAKKQGRQHGGFTWRYEE